MKVTLPNDCSKNFDLGSTMFKVINGKKIYGHVVEVKHRKGDRTQFTIKKFKK